MSKKKKKNSKTKMRNAKTRKREEKIVWCVILFYKRSLPERITDLVRFTLFFFYFLMLFCNN